MKNPNEPGIDHRARVPFWSGPAAMAGGVLLALAAVLHSMQPGGCIGMDCTTFKEGTPLIGLLTLAGLLLIVAGLFGLVAMARKARPLSQAGKAGLILAVAGVTVGVLAQLVQSLFFNNDFPLMPFFILPALLAIIVGFILVGVMVLRSKALPRWAGTMLIVTAALLLFANEQTAAILLAVPFALAWVAIGYVLWSRRDDRTHPGRAGAYA